MSMETSELKPSNRRILVIDDDPRIHRDFRKILAPDRSSQDELDRRWAALSGTAPDPTRGAVFEMDSAYQGEEGLELVRRAVASQRPYAVAFVDLHMPPGWDGVETVQRIWAECPDLEIVICTAHCDHSWHERLEAIGHSDRLLILRKPFDSMEVRQLAQSLVEKWNLASRVRRHGDEMDRMVQRTASLTRENRELQRREAHTRAMIESRVECIFSVNADGEIVELNPAAERAFGYSRDEVLGKSMDRLVMPAHPEQRYRGELQRYLRTGDCSILNRPIEVTALRRDGTEFPADLTITAVPSDGQPSFAALLHDSSERKRVEEALRHQAFHDPLTGLPNRTQFLERLEKAFRNTTGRGDAGFAVLFIDLDHFKRLNDTRGHAAGDRLLVEAARRLQSCARSSDIVARLGGDEFAMLLDGITGPDEAARVAQRVLDALARPFEIDGQPHSIAASIGIALSSPRYARASNMLEDADAAMYEAKTSGRACYKVFAGKAGEHEHSGESMGTPGKSATPDCSRIDANSMEFDTEVLAWIADSTHEPLDRWETR